MISVSSWQTSAHTPSHGLDFLGQTSLLLKSLRKEVYCRISNNSFLMAKPRRNLGATLTQSLLSFLKNNAHYFDVLDGARSLVHSDFNGFNILVRQNKERWNVTAVLDWEFAFAGSPLVDIGNMCRYSHLHPPIFESEFIRGYREQGGILSPEWKKVAKLLDLLSLCEFLNAPTPRDALRQEVVGLIMRTLEHWDEYDGQTALSQI